MAVGLSVSEVNALLNSFDGVWIKLHLGEPGAAGTANPAAETTRQQLSLAAASGGAVASDAELRWAGITGSQDASHFSMWSALVGGTYRGSEVITADAYLDGDDFVIPLGSFAMDMPVAA